MFSHQKVANNNGKEVIKDIFNAEYKGTTNMMDQLLSSSPSTPQTISHYLSYYFEKSDAENVEKNTDFMITFPVWNAGLETKFEWENNERNLKPVKLREDR